MTADPTSLQRALSEFVADAAVDWGVDVAGPLVRQALLDTFAVSIAGAQENAARVALAYAGRSFAGPKGAHAWLSARPLPPELAALASAAAAHALDYDDVTPAWRGHPSVVMFPALTALAEHCDASGHDLIRAYIIGFDVGASVGQTLVGRHYETGWHSTATIGVIAATAAGCRLLGLSANATSNALGLAVAQSAGVQVNFGSDAKVMQAGFAAANAVRACLLAADGLSASSHALDAAKGFTGLYAGGTADVPKVAGLDSEPCALARFGIELKRFPMCYAAHRAVEAALQLRTQLAGDFESIDSVAIEGSRDAHTPLRREPPTTGQEARFSVEFGVAVALVDGAVGLRSFDDRMLARPEIKRMMARCSAREVSGPRVPRRATVRIAMRTGVVHECRVDSVSSGVIDASALTAKVEDCLASVGAPGCGESLRDLLAANLMRPVSTWFGSDALNRIRQTVGLPTESRDSVMRECRHG